jgi:hypothetical protein
MQFPTPLKPVTVIIVALQANGESSYRDAKHLMAQTRLAWPGSQSFVFSDRAGDDGKHISNKVDLLREISKLVRKTSATSDILFCLSAHGYAHSNKQFVRIGVDRVFDHELHDALYDPMHVSCLSLCLVDTCHSGSLMNLPFCSTDGVHFLKDQNSPENVKPQSFCISACSDSELAGEDISDTYGWGGKLMCQFLDYLTVHPTFHIYQFYENVQFVFSKQSQQKSHPVLSRSFL